MIFSVAIGYLHQGRFYIQSAWVESDTEQEAIQNANVFAMSRTTDKTDSMFGGTVQAVAVKQTPLVYPSLKQRNPLEKLQSLLAEFDKSRNEAQQLYINTDDPLSAQLHRGTSQAFTRAFLLLRKTLTEIANET